MCKFRWNLNNDVNERLYKIIFDHSFFIFFFLLKRRSSKRESLKLIWKHQNDDVYVVKNVVFRNEDWSKSISNENDDITSSSFMNENNFNDFVFDDTNTSNFINDDICERILASLFFFSFSSSFVYHFISFEIIIFV